IRPPHPCGCGGRITCLRQRGGEKAKNRPCPPPAQADSLASLPEDTGSTLVTCVLAHSAGERPAGHRTHLMAVPRRRVRAERGKRRGGTLASKTEAAPKGLSTALPRDGKPPGVAVFWVPPAGFEPAHTAPEAVALSPELRGRSASSTVA